MRGPATLRDHVSDLPSHLDGRTGRGTASRRTEEKEERNQQKCGHKVNRHVGKSSSRMDRKSHGGSGMPELLDPADVGDRAGIFPVLTRPARRDPRPHFARWFPFIHPLHTMK